MKTQLAKLELYKSQLVNLKSSLTDVPSNVYSKDWKPITPLLPGLDAYLTRNDCMVVPDAKGCYSATRLLLIRTTKELDASNSRINDLNQVVDRLLGNITAIIDNLNEGSQETKVSLKIK